MEIHRHKICFFCIAAALVLIPGVFKQAVFAQSSLSTLDINKSISQYVLDEWTTDDGLPQNSITTILQTSDGYLWFGTEEGLVRFNGSYFTTYDKSNTNAFESDGITSLAETADGSLWIGVRGGGLIALKDNVFTPFVQNNSLSTLDITALFVDASEALWIGTFNGGLMKLEGNSLSYFNEDNGIGGRFVHEIAQDADNKIWVGSDDGLFYYTDGVFKRAEHEPINSAFVSALHVDSNQTLWVGTESGELFAVKGNEVIEYPTSFLPRTYVSSIIEDNAGSIWLGLNRGGLVRIHDNKIEYSHSEQFESPLSDGEVLSLFQDKEGSLWIGYQAIGLLRIRNEQFTPIGLPEGLRAENAMSLLEYPDGQMWIGTNNGLNVLKDGKTIPFSHSDTFEGLHILGLAAQNDSVWVGTMEKGLFLLANETIQPISAEHGLPSNSIFGLYLDSQNRLWVATDNGVAIYKNGEITTLDSEEGMQSNYITSFVEDDEGAIWIGSYDAGLSKFKDGEITYLTEEEGLSGNIILSLHIDDENILWIGTYGGGLNRYESGSISSFTTREGFFNDNVYSILEDEAGYLWFSCNKGIFKVAKEELNLAADNELDKVSYTVYNKENGLRNQEANGGFQPAAWKASDGSFWFPTLGGAVYTNPLETYQNQVLPDVHIERMTVDEVLIPSITDGIKLEAGARKISFRYAGLSYTVPGEILYKYRLEGIDESWSYATNDQVATYTNIPPGTYTFRVIAANNSGLWNETGASIQFIHLPFYYQTLWFKLLVAAFLIGIGASVYRARIVQLQKQRQELERVVEERTRDLRLEKEKTEESKAIIEKQAEKLIELDRFKTRFFANISHEFRTPLTMIIGPLENVLSGYYGDISDSLMRQISIMLRNAQRLLRLINQLLDLSKLEAGKMELQTSIRNIIPFLENILLSCTPMAENKRIALNFDSSLDEVQAYYEPDKMEKVFFNLLSNALKFTPNGGSISMNIEQLDASQEFVEGAVQVRVRDTGKGIPPTDLPYIFDRFHQVAGSNTKNQEGTGIGLALVRELILLHKGDITVTSELGVGTEFIITLPLGNSHLKEEQISANKSQVKDVSGITESNIITELAAETIDFDHEDPVSKALKASNEHSLSQGLILVVDDNNDILEYVGGILADKYLIEVASDGLDGYEKAQLLKPDLILSDLMMPRMDGNQFCQKVKSDPELNLTPFIIMTARATNELKIEGLELGADDYIAKPFNARELLARINNLLQLRENQKELKQLNKNLENKVKEQLEIILNDRVAYEAEILEEKEKAEESSRLKSIILDNVNHEFRTPIAGIIGSAEILEMEVNEELLEFVGYIKSNTQRLQNTLDSVLELSSLESNHLNLRLSKLSPEASLKDLASRFGPLAEEKGLAFTLDLPDTVSPINVDEFAFSRILDHLTDNAIKFTNTGSISIKVEEDSEFIFIHISDTGIGISESFMPTLFDAFVQESDGTARIFEGMGIGLAISRQLTEIMGGSLTAKSTKNTGTTMTLSFPVLHQDQEGALQSN